MTGWVRAVAVVGIVLAATPWVLKADLRPLMGPSSVLTTSRDTQYFTARPYLREPYERAAAMLRGMHVSTVGYVGGGDDWDYPLWHLLGGHVVLDAVQVKGRSVRYEVAHMPRVVLCTNVCDRPPGTWTAHHDDPITLWVRSG